MVCTFFLEDAKKTKKYAITTTVFSAIFFIACVTMFILGGMGASNRVSLLVCATVTSILCVILFCIAGLYFKRLKTLELLEIQEQNTRQTSNLEGVMHLSDNKEIDNSKNQDIIYRTMQVPETPKDESTAAAIIASMDINTFGFITERNESKSSSATSIRSSISINNNSEIVISSTQHTILPKGSQSINQSTSAVAATSFNIGCRTVDGDNSIRNETTENDFDILDIPDDDYVKNGPASASSRSINNIISFAEINNMQQLQNEQPLKLSYRFEIESTGDDLDTMKIDDNPIYIPPKKPAKKPSADVSFEAF